MKNSQILALVKTTPTYKRWTSKLTDEIFTSAGFEELYNNDYKLLEDFFGLSVRVVLNKIRSVNAVIPSTYKAIVEEFATEEGGITQRINIHPIKPVSPKFRNLQDGMSIDPYTVRKPKTDERFYKQNFDYSSFITLQDINLKKMFIQEDGIFTYVEGITKSFNEGYYIQKYEMFRNMINLTIHSTQFPMQQTQIYNGTTNPELANIDSDSPVDAQAAYRKFVQIIDNLNAFMKANPMADTLNAKKFMHGMNSDDYVLMMRYSIYNLIKSYEGVIGSGTGYIKNVIENLPFKVELVQDFGGITYVLASDHTTPLLPVYNKRTGEELGFNQNGGEYDPLDTSDTNVPLPEDQIEAVDPNANVFAILAERGVIFATQQNSYEVRSIYNPRGMYTNHFANQPNGSFNYDATYDMVVFSKATTTTTTKSKK